MVWWLTGSKNLGQYLLLTPLIYCKVHSFLNSVSKIFILWKQGPFTKPFKASPSWHQLKDLVFIKMKNTFKNEWILVVHLFPLCLVCSRNQVYSACCSTQNGPKISKPLVCVRVRACVNHFKGADMRPHLCMSIFFGKNVQVRAGAPHTTKMCAMCVRVWTKIHPPKVFKLAKWTTRF